MGQNRTAAYPKHKGWWYDGINDRLVCVFNGTEVFDIDANDFALAFATAITGGLQIVSGTLNIDGIADFAADVKFNSTITAGADGVGSDGEQLTSGGAAAECDWAAAASVREFKHVGEMVNPKDVLERLLGVNVYKFRYRRKDESEDHIITTGDYKTEYTGVMADELPEAMHYKGKIFSPVSAFGMLLAAFQALTQEVRELKATQA